MTLTEFLAWCNERKDSQEHVCTIALDIENQDTMTFEQRCEFVDEITQWRVALELLSRNHIWEFQTPGKCIETWELCIERNKSDICLTREQAELVTRIKLQAVFDELHVELNESGGETNESCPDCGHYKCECDDSL